MLVKNILSGKLNTTIYTITKDHTITDAVSDLSAQRVGVLIVSQDGKTIDGILSERDVIREMGQRGTTCLSDKVGDMMTGTVMSCTLSDTTQMVLETMTQGRFRPYASCRQR